MAPRSGHAPDGKNRARSVILPDFGMPPRGHLQNTEYERAEALSSVFGESEAYYFRGSLKMDRALATLSCIFVTASAGKVTAT